MRKLFTPVLLIALAAAGWWWWQNTADKGATGTPPVIVRTAAAETRDVPLSLENVGTVVTNDSVGVRARLDSQVMEVAFRDGDYVEQGDLLFVLDDRMLKADLARDEAQLANLKRQYERNVQLAAKGFETQANLEDSKAAYEAQKAVADNIKVQLEYTRITAPISGRTGTINITAGNTVKANDTQPLVTINQVKPIRVQVSLPQRYLGSVREAMAKGPVTVTATREGGGTPSTGTLEYVDNAVDTATGTFAARASFPNEDEALWPGMFVHLRLVLGNEKNAVTVPEVAVQHGQSGDFVFVIAGGKASKRSIKTARMQDGLAVIESGIAPGEQVAVDGIMSLNDGSAITIQSNGAAPSDEPPPASP